MGLISFFRGLFGRRHKAKEKHKVKHTQKHKVKHPDKKHQKHKAKIKHKSQQTKQKYSIYHKLKPKKIKHKIKTLGKNKKAAPKTKSIKNVPKKSEIIISSKSSKVKSSTNQKYGIPAGHEHEAKLKVAERRSEIDEFYTEPKGKVSLKVMEKGSPEFEPTAKDDHDFVFKERKFSKREKQEIKKIEDIIKTKKESGFVTTNMDTVLDIVNKMGKVRSDYLSGALKMSEKSVEEVAKILAKNDMIDIHYPFIGKMELKRKGGKNG